jgi:hypothetical protein
LIGLALWAHERRPAGPPALQGDAPRASRIASEAAAARR